MVSRSKSLPFTVVLAAWSLQMRCISQVPFSLVEHVSSSAKFFLQPMSFSTQSLPLPDLAMPKILLICHGWRESGFHHDRTTACSIFNIATPSSLLFFLCFSLLAAVPLRVNEAFQYFLVTIEVGHPGAILGPASELPTAPPFFYFYLSRRRFHENDLSLRARLQSTVVLWPSLVLANSILCSPPSTAAGLLSFLSLRPAPFFFFLFVKISY